MDTDEHLGHTSDWWSSRFDGLVETGTSHGARFPCVVSHMGLHMLEYGMGYSLRPWEVVIVVVVL